MNSKSLRPISFFAIGIILIAVTSCSQKYFHLHKIKVEKSQSVTKKVETKSDAIPAENIIASSDSTPAGLSFEHASAFSYKQEVIKQSGKDSIAIRAQKGNTKSARVLPKGDTNPETYNKASVWAFIFSMLCILAAISVAITPSGVSWLVLLFLILAMYEGAKGRDEIAMNHQKGIGFAITGLLIGFLVLTAFFGLMCALMIAIMTLGQLEEKAYINIFFVSWLITFTLISALIIRREAKLRKPETK